MPFAVPAVCGGCRRTFPVGSFSGSPQFRACAAGPCPYCGSNGIIPDGVYTFADEVVGVVRTRRLSRRTVKRVEDVLTQASAEGTAPDVAVHRVESQVPEAKPLVPAFERFYKQNTGLVTIVAVMAAIVGCVFAGMGLRTTTTTTTTTQPPSVTITRPQHEVPEDDPPIDTERVMQIYTELHAPRSHGGKGGPGRNDPCPCESGKKFKKCHGKPH